MRNPTERYYVTITAHLHPSEPPIFEVWNGIEHVASETVLFDYTDWHSSWRAVIEELAEARRLDNVRVRVAYESEY